VICASAHRWVTNNRIAGTATTSASTINGPGPRGPDERVGAGGDDLGTPFTPASTA
jgi:hypothetical protein